MAGFLFAFPASVLDFPCLDVSRFQCFWFWLSRGLLEPFIIKLHIMDPFIQKMADELEAEQTSKRLESERLVYDLRLSHEMAPRMWGELRAWLKQACKDLVVGGNPVFEFEVWPNTEAQIRRLDKPCRLHVEFIADGQRICYECGDGRGEFIIRVNTDRTVCWETPHHLPYTTAEVGNFLLEKLRKSVF